MNRPDLGAVRESAGRVIPSPSVAFTPVGGDGILHDEAGDEVHVLNASAARVWELCARRPTVSELIAALAESYRMSADAVRDDVLALLVDLHARGLVECAVLEEP